MILSNMSKTAKLFIDAGFESDLFNNDELNQYKYKKVIDYCKKYNKLPSTNIKLPSTNIRDKNHPEYNLGLWLSNMRSRHKNNKLYPSIKTIIEESGLSYIFECYNPEQHALDMTLKVINYYKENNNCSPSSKSSNPEIKKMGSWLIKMRIAKKGEYNKLINKFYPSMQTLAESHGLPHIFEQIDNEQIKLNICSDVIEYRNKNNKWPPDNIKESNEVRKLARWLSRMRENKYKISPSLQKMANDAGYPHMFIKLNSEEEVIIKCKELIEYYNLHGRKPPEKHELHNWIRKMREIKKIAEFIKKESFDI